LHDTIVKMNASTSARMNWRLYENIEAGLKENSEHIVSEELCNETHSIHAIKRTREQLDIEKLNLK